MGAGLLRRPTGDGGVGLPELLVAMGMFGIVVAAIGAVFVGLVDTSRIASTKTATTADARIAMEAMTRSLRVAVVPKGEPSALTVSTTTELQFYASLNRGTGQDADRPTRVTYAYVPATGCVTETQVVAGDSTAADAGARPFTWTTAGTTKCLIRTSAAPAFSYFDLGTIRRADDTLVAPIVPATDAQRATVVSIEAALDVKDPQRPDITGVIARDRVTLTNVFLDAGGT